MTIIIIIITIIIIIAIYFRSPEEDKMKEVSDKYQVQEIQKFIKFVTSYHKIKWHVSQTTFC